MAVILALARRPAVSPKRLPWGQHSKDGGACGEECPPDSGLDHHDDHRRRAARHGRHDGEQELLRGDRAVRPALHQQPGDRATGWPPQSYAFGHPSLPNYLDIVSGSNQGVTDDNPPSSHSFPGAPTLADQLAAAGISEKAYAENLPADPTTTPGDYAVRHCPLGILPQHEDHRRQRLVARPDLNGANAPDFVWYTPNLINDEHDGTVAAGRRLPLLFHPEVQATSLVQGRRPDHRRVG